MTDVDIGCKGRSEHEVYILNIIYVCILIRYYICVFMLYIIYIYRERERERWGRRVLLIFIHFINCCVLLLSLYPPPPQPVFYDVYYDVTKPSILISSLTSDTLPAYIKALTLYYNLY